MKLAVIVAAAVFGAAIPAITFAAPAAGQSATAAQTAPQLHAALRGLWQGHITTTRDYGIAVHAGDKAAADKAEGAVIDNAKQISGAVAGFYGAAAGDGLLKLLGGHWGGVKDLTQAAKAGDHAAEGNPPIFNWGQK